MNLLILESAEQRYRQSQVQRQYTQSRGSQNSSLLLRADLDLGVELNLT